MGLRWATSRTRLWALLRALVGVGILVALGLRLGSGPFVEGLRAVDLGSAFLALAVGVLTTVCSAWRWCLVARGLGLRLTLPVAVAECYRALFLNSVLPAGVLGDVNRAVVHGRLAADLRRSALAVVLERTAGQVVLVLVAAVLITAPTVPLAVLAHPAAAVIVAVIAAVVAVAALVAIGVTAGVAENPGRQIGTWLGVTAASVVTLVGYLTVFVVAARAAGSQAAVGELLPLLVLALLAMALPINVGGWGPREAVSTAAFGAAGFGAAQGLAAAVVYGTLSLIACVPGLGVLLFLRRAATADGAPARRTNSKTVPPGTSAH